MSRDDSIDAVKGESGVDVVVAKQAPVVLVPAGGWLTHADFTRSGPDLLITGQNGEQILVRGYFSSADSPSLTTEGGLSISGNIVGRLAGPLAPGQYAQAGDAAATDPIGQITTI